MPKKYVPDGVYLACDKGCAPCRLKVTSHDFSYIYGLHLATEADKQPDVNIPPMHTCTATGKACEPKPTAWEKVKDGVSINQDRLLLEDSILPCSEGGIIKIYFSAAEAQAACAPPPPKKKSLLDKLSDAASHWGPVGTYVQFEIGVGEGIAGGVKGIGEGLWTLAKGGWHVATHPVETAESVSNATVAAANWASKGENWSNAYNATSEGISNAADWASKGENWSNTANSVGDWASKQSPRDWGNITGRGAFEVALAVGTAGAGEAVNGAAKVGEAANLAEKAGEAANLADKAGEAANLADKAGEAGNLADKAGEAANMIDKLGEGQKLGEVVTETVEDLTNFEKKWNEVFDQKRIDEAYEQYREKKLAEGKAPRSKEDWFDGNKGRGGYKNVLKGQMGEYEADQQMAAKGYTKLNHDGELVDPLNPPKGKGLDGVWHDPGPPPKYIISETKFGGSKLTGNQMSDEWIEKNLQKSVSNSDYEKILDELDKGNVEKQLLNVDENGKVITTILK